MKQLKNAMAWKWVSLFLLISGLFLSKSNAQTRPPAYPLITHDPYFSIWSFGDKLNESPTKHWTGKNQPLNGVIEVDGQKYRFLGAEIPTYKAIVPLGQPSAGPARYTFTQPADGWQKPTFDDAAWKTGKAPFGSASTDGKQTIWEGKDVWYRQSFTLNDLNFNKLLLDASHDDDVDIFFNGVLAYQCGPCYSSGYVVKQPSIEAIKALKVGVNVLAVHCKNTGGPGFIDVGLSDEIPAKNPIRLAQQTAATLTATQTSYSFACGQVKLGVTFTSPLLLDELETLARPASYVTFTVQSLDNKIHKANIYFGMGAEIAVNTPSQAVVFSKMDVDGMTVFKIGSKEQNILGRKGDDVRIDWGNAYLAVPQLKTPPSSSGEAEARGKESGFETGEMNTGSKELSRHCILAYDDEYSVQYFGKNLRPWWRRDGKTTAQTMLAVAEKDYARLMNKCRQFDEKLYQDALKAGGKAYADMCQMAYRQAIAAHKIVSNDGQLLFFSKENFSNGSIGTVDVTYPSAPLFLLYNPDLLKGMLEFICYYSESGKWTKPFAAHDVGTYPLANGQTYPEDMPVEECGNMLILFGAIAAVENNANYAQKHWKTLTTWAEYLKKEGFDPANQLCTDDFAGHLARNANLSIKAIMGLAAYAKMAKMLGQNPIADDYLNAAKTMAGDWQKLATDGDHYALTFDKKGTWSQKYNLVWDKLLNLNIFPKEVAKKEIKYYLSKQQPYGLPLDSRRTYTKSDWIIWTATMADNQADFEAIMKPLSRFVNEGTDRIPLSDWHETTNGKHVGFRARSVVGGYFIKMLEGKMVK